MRGSTVIGGACCFGLVLLIVSLTLLMRFQFGFFVFVVGWIFILCVLPAGIVAEIAQRKTDKKEPLEKGPSTGVIQERIITERVLVVCPFCSTKVEQGTSFCTNCGGKM